MKRLVAVFYFAIVALGYVASASAEGRYAYEYYSEDDRDRHIPHGNGRNDWYESEDREQRFYAPPRYQQQLPIQIYLPPNPNFYPKDYSQNYLRNPPNPQTRYNNQWRERRRELERMPQSPYFENQFDRDDTHW